MFLEGDSFKIRHCYVKKWPCLIMIDFPRVGKCLLQLQGSHRLEKYLNLEGLLDLKSP